MEVVASNVLCIFGIIAVLLLGVIFLCGRSVALPFRQSGPLSLGFFLGLLYCLCWCVSISDAFPFSSDLREVFPPRICLNDSCFSEKITDSLVLAFLVLSVPLFQIRNHFALKELYPMRQSIDLQTVLQQKENALPLSSMEHKKIVALSREFAHVIVTLAHDATVHPVLLFFKRSRVKYLRRLIDKLIKVFAQTPGLLDSALRQANAPQLVAFASHSSLFLMHEQTANLSRDAKVVLLDALQKNSALLHRNESRQQWVVELLTSTSEQDLLVMQSLLDGGGDYQSLRKLIFEDITSITLRENVLDHFKRVAVHEDFSEKPVLRKILSDIDDTLFSSGGKFPAGIDKRFPSKAVYPGLLQFYTELDAQWRITKLLPKSMLKEKHDMLESGFCNLIFLSARPHIYKDLSERFTYSLFSQWRHQGLLYGMPTLIPGRLGSSLEGAISSLLQLPRAWYSVGLEKLESIRKCTQLYPSHKMIFFGDNGQGDLLAAECALQESPPLVMVAFINEVQNRRQSLSMYSSLSVEEQEKRWKELGIIWMKTPVEGAVQAERRGLLSPESLLHVCQAAVNDLEALAMRHPKDASWPERVEELNSALKDAQSLHKGIQLIDVEQLLRQMQDFMDIREGNAPEQLEVSQLQTSLLQS